MTSTTDVRPVTLVTGASRGIGAEIAADLTRRGHHVIGLARKKPEGFAGTFVAADLSDAKATAGALAEIVGAYRPLHLVNNAGIAINKPLAEASLADFEAMMAVNLRAAFQAMQAVVPVMREAGFGRIVNIGSRAALGKEGRGIYAATKGGLLSMTRTIALETARAGITCNLVAPGPIETDMIRIGYPEGSPARASLTGQVPVGRFGRPEEIAHAVAYFLDAAAGFTTGQALYVCGGLTVGAVQV
ncbi:MAG: SDR family oxidoreductase [Hyphomicrobiaceae bacterium]